MHVTLRLGMAAPTLACVLLFCSAIQASVGSEYDSGGRRSILQAAAHSYDGCMPGLFSAASGCAGCDVAAGWCADVGGEACSRDCAGAREDTARFPPLTAVEMPAVVASAVANLAAVLSGKTPAAAIPTVPIPVSAAKTSIATPAVGTTAANRNAATPAAAATPVTVIPTIAGSSAAAPPMGTPAVAAPVVDTPVAAAPGAALLAAEAPEVSQARGLAGGGALALHALCGNKAVLPRNSTAPVFGSGQPGDSVRVVLRRGSATVAQGSAVVGADGRWVAPLGNLPAGSGFSLDASVASRKQTVTAVDVAVGELWLIAGQSNVGITLDQLTRTNEISFPPFTNTARALLKTAAQHPMLHLFKVPMAASATPITALPTTATWAVNNQTVAASYGALGFITFSDLADQLGVHVGVVQADIGGSSIVQWLPTQVLAAIKRPATPRDSPRLNDYNAMIAPMKGAAWTGAVWYQGESDAGLKDVNPLYQFYVPLLTALLSSWRNTFSQPQLTWQIIQLPIYNSAYRAQFSINGQSGDSQNRNHWPYVREAQRRVANADPLATLVSAFDLGLTGRIHPPNKFLLANRLTASILKQQTGSDKYDATGPTFVSAKYSTSNVVVTFGNVAEGLLIAIKQPFAVTALDRKPSTFNIDCFEVMFGTQWINSTGSLTSSSSVTATWVGQDGQTPTNVRYGWYDYAVCNLYNERELPTVPFTSDPNPF